MKKLLLVRETSVLLLFFMMALSAQAITIEDVEIEGPDAFFGPIDSTIKVIVTASGLTNGTIQADFSSVSECDGNPIVTLIQAGEESYEGSCDASAEIASLSGEAESGEIVVEAVEGNDSDTDTVTVNLQNLGVPDLSSRSCIANGPLTTNLSAVTDFSDVQLVLDLKLKGSAVCNPDDLPWGNSFINVATITFEGVDLARPDIEDELDGLGSSIQLYIGEQGSRIGIDTSDFGALDSPASVVFSYIPLTAQPAIESDDGAASQIQYTFGKSIFFNYGGFSKSVPNMTVTFKADGFAFYDVVDAVDPVVGIEPGFNITIDGTGTAVGSVAYYADGQLVSMNDEGGIHDECLNLTVYWDKIRCNFNPGDTANFTVVATDKAGNAKSAQYIEQQADDHPPLLVSNYTSPSNLTVGSPVSIFTVWNYTGALTCDLYANSNLIQTMPATQAACDFVYNTGAGDIPSVTFRVKAMDNSSRMAESADLVVLVQNSTSNETPPVAYCGDSVCQATETCGTCSQDCGVCPRRSGGGGGGGGGSATIPWECTEWSACINNRQSQNCTYGYKTKFNTRNCTSPVKPVLPMIKTPTIEDVEVEQNRSVPLAALAQANATNASAVPAEPGAGNLVTGAAADAGGSSTWYYAFGAILLVGLAAFAFFRKSKGKPESDFPLIRP